MYRNILIPPKAEFRGGQSEGYIARQAKEKWKIVKAWKVFTSVILSGKQSIEYARSATKFLFFYSIVTLVIRSL